MLSQPGTRLLRARHHSRRCALRRPAGEAPPLIVGRYVRPMSASQTLDYDYPYSLAPGAVRETYASRETMGFGTHHRNRGRGCARTPVTPLRRATFTSRSRFEIASGVLSEPTRPMWPTSDIPVASSAPVFVGPFSHAFAWVLPGGSRRDRIYRCRVTDNGFPDPGRLPSIGAFSRGQSLRSAETPVPSVPRAGFCPTLMRGG
jgi:hypothetical protein